MQHDSFVPLPGSFVLPILLSHPSQNLRGQTVLFFLEPFFFVDPTSMQLPAHYHAGAHLTRAVV